MSVLIIVVVGIIMTGIELARPGRQWPKVRGWIWRAFGMTSIQAGAVFLAGITWDQWFIEHRIWSADPLGEVGGSVVGYAVLTFFYYWWHRWRHEVPFLWRWFHQLHHSPQRLEVITSFYKHPFEIATNALLSSVVMYLVVGLSPAAAAGATLLSGLAELFYHWNVKTPHWIGYIIQRPESHCVHHESGEHKYNYGDLPLWDMLFGTFKNPREFDRTCGFGEKEHALGAMLIGRDVTGETQDRPGNIARLAVLGAVGFAGMFGDIAGVGAVRGLAAATAASPAPKVFTSHGDWETFSPRFALHVDDRPGVRVTPQLYAQLEGPYNRRNVYGAVISYGPVLSASEKTRGLYEEVARRAVCAEFGAPVLTELGIEPGRVTRVSYTKPDGAVVWSDAIECEVRR